MNDLSAWLVSVEGTDTGKTLAVFLALAAAVLHAGFGTLQKGRHNPWLSRAAIDASYSLMALPIALIVVPFPEPALWPIFVGVWIIHVAYKICQGMAY
jgi:ABC-type antimicrobial peptide transport system permease subunit